MKKKVIIVLALLMICMSSCVYSLFPIYTKDTIVYLPELEGKWVEPDNPDNYITLVPSSLKNASLYIDGSKRSANEPRVRMKWSTTNNHKDYVIVNGDTIRDKKIVDAYSKAQLDSMNQEIKGAADRLISNAKDLADERGMADLNYSRDEKSYDLTFVENGEVQFSFLMHTVEIDDKIFMDLYPTEKEFEDGIGANLFPVHTFMKLEMSKDELNMIHFDLEKLQKLFESNLIRLRHENVDGTVLITAQPKELQKFLSKYADDESVFDETSRYIREPSK